MSKEKNRISPFSNEADALGIGGLSIENRLDRISIYGSIDITRDREGLVHAERLKSLFEAIVATMHDEHLPESISITPTDQISNPFADDGAS